MRIISAYDENSAIPYLQLAGTGGHQKEFKASLNLKAEQACPQVSIDVLSIVSDLLNKTTTLQTMKATTANVTISF
jgi:hypothetical protein